MLKPVGKSITPLPWWDLGRAQMVMDAATFNMSN